MGPTTCLVRHCSPAGKRWRTERGDGPVTAAIILPILLTVTFALVQTGLYYHARNVISAATQVGVEDARTVGGSAAAGQASASRYINEVAPDLLDDVNVTSSRDSGSARVAATGHAPSLVPGWNLPLLEAEAVAPIEEVTRP